MRLNQFIARHSGYSRRQADRFIEQGQVTVNGQLASVGQQVTDADEVSLDGQPLLASTRRTIMVHKPVGYVVSRAGQGSPTIYDLLPAQLHQLKPVGRLDKNSSGLLLLTNDGELANKLTHPRYKKLKIYHVTLDKPLARQHQTAIEQGIELDDGVSKFEIRPIRDNKLEIKISEGRKRQIRRTFTALGYTVTALHRTQFGPYKLGSLALGQWEDLMSNVSSDVGGAAKLVE